jgi:hypothetical protein
VEGEGAWVVALAAGSVAAPAMVWVSALESGWVSASGPEWVSESGPVSELVYEGAEALGSERA